MKFEKVTYQKAFVIGPYLQEKIGFEIIIDSGIGETPAQALDRAKEEAEMWHKSSNPIIPDNSIPIGPTQTIQVKPEDRETGVTPELILSSKDLTELESFRWHLKKNNELERAYMVRHDQLTEKQ